VVRLALARHFDGVGRDDDLRSFTQDALAAPDPDAAYAPERLRLHLHGRSVGLLRRRRPLPTARVDDGLVRLGARPVGGVPGTHRLFGGDREWRATFRPRDDGLEVSLGGQPEGNRRGTEAAGIEQLLLALCSLAEELDAELEVERPSRAGLQFSPADIPQVLRALGATR